MAGCGNLQEKGVVEVGTTRSDFIAVKLMGLMVAILVPLSGRILPDKSNASVFSLLV